MQIKPLNIVFILSFFLTVVLNGQCWPEGLTHDTRPEAQWLSCEKKMSPNETRGNSLWIMYDFGETYSLGTSSIWNFNEPGFTDYGITRLAVDISNDGQRWQTLGEYNLNMATGRRDEGGQLGPDFKGAGARYVLFTALQNGRGTDNCAGLAEIRINLANSTATKEFAEVSPLKVSPNPSQGIIQVELPENQIRELSILDIQGRVLLEVTPNQPKTNLDLSHWAAGFYLVEAIGKDGRRYRKKFTIM